MSSTESAASLPSPRVAGASTAIEFRVLGSLDLREFDGRALDATVAHPKRIALLAYLAAAAPRRFHRRDTLLGLFWPELDQDHARVALRKAVHYLRRALGPEVIVRRGEEEIGLAEKRIWCDAATFEQAADSGRYCEALALYRGELLEGFFISRAAAFERWVDAARARLREKAAAAARNAAELSEMAGDVQEAIRWARRELSLSPCDECAVRRLISLLDRVGDRAGAIRAGDEFARQLAKEYGCEPSTATKDLVEAVRARR